MRDSDQDFDWVVPQHRMEGLAKHIDWCREGYASTDRPGVKRAYLRVKRAYLREIAVTLLDHDRVGVQHAKRLADGRKMGTRRALDFRWDFGVLIKNPFAVVRMTGV